MADFLTVQDTPLTITLNGKQYTFPIWTTGEILPVLSKIRDERVLALRKEIPAQKITSQLAAYMIAKEETVQLDPHDAYLYFMSVGGVDVCLMHSLKKSGVSAVEAQEVLDKLTYRQKAQIAVRVSGIYEPAEPDHPDKKKDKETNKNAGFGEQQAVPDQPVGFGETANP